MFKWNPNICDYEYMDQAGMAAGSTYAAVAVTNPDPEADKPESSSMQPRLRKTRKPNRKGKTKFE